MEKNFKANGLVGCNGDCGTCGCPNCGEQFAKLIMGRTKRNHRRWTRRQERGLMREILSIYNGRSM
jgi:hypothetical protein